MINKITIQNQYIIFLIFLLTSVGLRFFSFFPSVMDHDESTYMIIGRELLQGKSLYSEVTDTKPAGIFLFYAGLEYLFGSSIFWKRFVFAILVGITGFLVSRISNKLFKNNIVAFASGLIYIIYTSVWNYHGRSPNTELLFNVFTCLGLLLFLNKNKWYYILSGIIMGIGFIVKYLILFDFGAFLLFFFLVEMTKKENLRDVRIWLRYVLSGLAFLVPFALVNLYFWVGDHFNDFYFVTYVLPGQYGSSPSLTRYFIMLLDFTAKFIPISYLIFYVIFNKNKPWEKEHKLFFILWIISVFFAIYIPGKEFSHYTIQLMLPLSLIAGLFFHPNFKSDKISVQIFSKKYGWYAFGAIMFIIQITGYQNEFLKPDVEEEVATYISGKIKKNDVVFVSNYQQIIYYLLDVDAPTKFIHSNLLFTDNQKAFGINGNEEIKRIIDTKPRFVLVQNKNQVVEEMIKDNYKRVKDFNDKKVILFEHIR